MPKTIKFGNRTITVPDTFTDEQIAEVLASSQQPPAIESQPGPAMRAGQDVLRGLRQFGETLGPMISMFPRGPVDLGPADASDLQPTPEETFGSLKSLAMIPVELGKNLLRGPAEAVSTLTGVDQPNELESWWQWGGRNAPALIPLAGGAFKALAGSRQAAMAGRVPRGQILHGAEQFQDVLGRPPLPNLPETGGRAFPMPLEAPPPSAPAPIATPPPTRPAPAPTRVGPTVGEMRGAYGAERTADYMNQMPGLREELGVPITREMVQDISGGPSRVPTAVTNAELDSHYARRIADESGMMTTGLAQDLYNMMMQARGLSMLSGYAPVKSLAGNVGALATHGLETGRGLAPLWELATPDFWGDVRSAWSSRANPAQTTSPRGTGAINFIGRGMGAFDQATTEALMRQGASLDDAQKLLLTRPHRTFEEGLSKVNPAGRELFNFVFPFQRTPWNAMSEGFDAAGEMLTPSEWAQNFRKPAMTLGTTVLGEQAGEQTESIPALGILSALAGRRGLPFLFGAGLGRLSTTGSPGEAVKALQGVSPLTEYGFRGLFSPVDQFTFGPARRAWLGEQP